MFNKLKQLKDLRSQAKKMQSTLSAESVTIEKNGTKVVMNGNMQVTELTTNEELKKENSDAILTDCINEAIKKIQKIMAQKMQEMGGFPGLQ